MIDLMFPVHMDGYNPHQSSGIQNPGGGMATKLLSVKQALSTYYKVYPISSFSEQRNEFLIIEPLTIRLTEQDFDTWIEELHACRAKKILHCSEMDVCRWSPNTLRKVVEAVDVVTANTKYQKNMITTLSDGFCHPYYLCDPIDSSLFRPGPEKKRRVFSAGCISKIKNTQFIVDVFREGRRVWGDSVEIAYFGSAGLWGHEVPDDLKIQREMEDVVDFFRGGVSRNELAMLFGESLIYVGKSQHDVYSSTHVEILASGAISVGGGHPMYKERPGISGLKEVDEFVLEIEALLNLSQASLAQGAQESRDYVLQRCGFDAFLNQFQVILQEMI